MEEATIYIPGFFNSSFGEQSPAYSLGLIFACQRSLLIDYSALIRPSLPKETQLCCCPQLHVWPQQGAAQTQAVFPGGLFISLTQKQQSS